MERQPLEPIAKNGNYLFGSVSPFLAFKIIDDNFRLFIDAVEVTKCMDMEEEVSAWR
jgi:hypothetical protein